MSNFIKTMSFLKRNGIKTTTNMVCERLDKKHVEMRQIASNSYNGVKNFSCVEREENQEEVYKKHKETSFEKEYSFSIVVPCYETKKEYLIELMDSVTKQTYSKVELILADASDTNVVKETAMEYAKTNSIPFYTKATNSKKEVTSFRIQYAKLNGNKGISENTNRGIEIAAGDYVGLLDHDDMLCYDALFEIVEYLQEKEYLMVYTDEDKGDGELTKFHTPNFKPDFNYELLLSNNYICHFTVIKREVIQKLLLRKEYDGAQDYDLFLRTVQYAKETFGKTFRSEIGHVDQVLYHWRCHEQSTAANPESKRYAYEAGKAALHDHLKSCGYEVEVFNSQNLGFYHVNWNMNLIEREGVGAICGRVIHKGKVVGGPKLKSWTCFIGLKKNYGGYLHQANFPIEVDYVDKRCVLFHQKYEAIFSERDDLSLDEKIKQIKQNGDVILYSPDFVIDLKESVKNV